LTEELKELDEALESVTSLNSALASAKNQIHKKIKDLSAEVSTLKEELETKSEDTKQKDELLSKLEKENASLKGEIGAIRDQMSKVSKLYQDLSKEKEETIDLKELLSIYIILLEEVFAARPHARILYMLHGSTSKLDKESVIKASGFQPAIVLKSIYDLANAKLVEYDMEKTEVTLIRKLY
jgi:predicted nuclease with TOPRIM domain